MGVIHMGGESKEGSLAGTNPPDKVGVFPSAVVEVKPG